LQEIRKEKKTMNTKAIYFDMDGTIADLYGVTDWLEMLMNGNELPYAIAKPLVRLATLARLLNDLQKSGYTVGIVSWLAKNSTIDYDARVTNAKTQWLNRHLKSVHFDEIHIVKYGTPKQNIVKYPNGVLFDDEEQNRKNWTGKAFDEKNIAEILKELKKSLDK
jgi:hypothetical protein